MHADLTASATRCSAPDVAITVLVESRANTVKAIADVGAREGRFLLGSVADKVLRTSVIPVLLNGPDGH